VQRILAAHVKEYASLSRTCPGGGQTLMRRKTEQNHHSVTSVVFLDDTVLASAGANDGTIKLWDLRKTCYKVKTSFGIDFVCKKLIDFAGRQACGNQKLFISPGVLLIGCL
jgi:WD40 repeat protein